mmetsp:Transcript_19392/g.21567  ORF Transcript_19392/g.21567 Transcript_19392/m.21567 type:complete len:498 (+) Transcript_19392:41-1534(+)
MGPFLAFIWLAGFVGLIVMLFLYLENEGYRNHYSSRYARYRDTLAWDKSAYAELQDRLCNENPGVHNLRVFIGTWNVGDNAPANDKLGEWIQKDYDIYAISAQECAYPPRGHSTINKDWIAAIRAFFKQNGQRYKLVDTIDLREAIRLSVWIKADLRPLVSNVQRDKIATKFPVLWRKGGTAIKFDFLSTSMLFVNAHFTAHQHNITSRNNDAQMIMRKIRLGNKNFDMGNQFNYVFWCGDLNYRIEMDKEKALNLIDNAQWTDLEKHDQLINQMRENNVLDSFVEQPIRFHPTYKWKRNKGDYDRKAPRVPAWCDRVLSKTLKGSYIKPIAYDAVTTMLTSDHLAVWAGYEIQAENIFYSIGQDSHEYTIDFSTIEVNLNEKISYSKKNPKQEHVVICAPFLKETQSTCNPSNTITQDTSLTAITCRLTEQAISKQYLYLVVYRNTKESKTEILKGDAPLFLGDLVNKPNMSMSLDVYEGGLVVGSILVRATLTPI